ncbi:UvrD-helicase domain-containing protein, partial [bacterium]|nr:UvrD-helicase domain-containing protein [bacterium]
DTAPELKDKIDREIEQIEAAPIFTIHSFCQKILGENAIYSNYSQNLNQIDEDKAIDVFVNKYMRDVLAKDSADKKIFMFLHENASGAANANNRPFQEVATEALKKYYLDKNGNENSDIISLDVLSPTEESECADAKDYAKCMRYMVTKHLKNMYLAWQQEKKDKNMQTYGDMIKIVHDAIADNTSGLLLKLKETYKYAIIDEFQDTNQLQWNIFRQIFTTDDEHHITIVGDPKQSIFSFQGADPAVYNIAKEYIIAHRGADMNLGTNYRSSAPVIDAINLLSTSTSFCGYAPDEYQDSKAADKIQPATLFGTEEKPVHIIDTSFPAEQMIVSKIIEYCTPGADNKTALQIWNKDKKEYRNATFDDFTIIVRSRYDATDLIAQMKTAGIPVMWHKEDTLFSNKEATDWIAILSAIAAPDFNSSNRYILRAALKTAFFDVHMDEINNEKFDDILCNERQILTKWRNLATKRQYPQLLNAIFEDSGLATRLASYDKIQSLAKYNQIGNFILDCLISKHNSIATVIKTLKQNKAKDSDNDEKTSVEKATDSPSVKAITIHSAKGLEFPVVFYLLKANGKKAKFVRVQHDNGRTVLNIAFDRESKDSESEWRALQYVAITRTSSLLFLIGDPKIINNFTELQISHPDLFLREMDVIKYTSAAGILTHANGDDAPTKKPGQIQLSNKKLYKHSYTSLSHHNTDSGENPNDFSSDGPAGRIDKEQDTDYPSQPDIIAQFDSDSGVSICDNMYDVNMVQSVSDNKTPERGKTYGTIIHEIFEKIDFHSFETNDASKCTDELIKVIDRCCQKYGVKYSTDIIISFITNTMTANLPEIMGGHATGNRFQLSNLAEQDKKSEIEFNMRPDMGKNLLNYCNGFIDLLFVREINGNKVYSILDWKTDLFDAPKYVDYQYLKSHTDEQYAIQRVLYSYCLIQWLKLFYPDKSESEIFNDHFGGIYYVYVRGCAGGTGNGIYAHTWKNFETLQKSFDGITTIINGLYNG